jgi:soluble lytic murein transglycosylase-like protein
MQLMPETAIAFGVRNRFGVQDNIRGGVAYLAWLMTLFKGDLRLATAAYLVGQDRILACGLACSSKEAYQYVTRVLERFREREVKTIAGGKR